MAVQKSSIYEVTDQALAITKKYISKVPETIVDVKEKKEEWEVTVEVLERKAVPDTQDLLGRYVIRLNKNGQLIGWTQKMIRKRSDRITPPETGEGGNNP
jgi:hypothetical protein